jgi:hypothetical protein
MKFHSISRFSRRYAAMVLPSPSKELMNGVRAALGLDEVGMKQAVQLVKDWLKQQAHLPQEIGK